MALERLKLADAILHPVAPMPTYRYSKFRNSSRTIGLGFVELADDAEALAFGVRVAREMMHKNRERYAGWTMDVTESGRTVGAIPFDAAVPIPELLS